MKNIKVGILIAYDYEFIKVSLPLIYDHVQEIHFAVDAEGLTWAGKSFEIKPEFWDWITEFDRNSKIRIYRDHFYVKELTAMQCETRERMLLAKHMGECDWYVQIDADEYFVDFPAFIRRLNWYEPKVPTTVACRVATLFKQEGGGYLVIAESIEKLNFATNNPVYDVGRNNDTGNVYEYWDDLVLHQSWARSPEEIYLKLHNWGHKDDFNVNSFYKLWNAVDKDNAYALSNFHPLVGSSWRKLRFISGTIPELIQSKQIACIYEPERPVVRKKPLLSRLWKEIKS